MARSPSTHPARIVFHHESFRETEGGGAELICEDSADVSETVIFPILPSQRQGVEDLRLVRFTEDDGRQQIFGTYTAYDGRDVRQELLRGIDFRTVGMHRLGGRMAGHKGMALFPRRIRGRYVMLGRQDNENIWLLESDDLYQWDGGDRSCPRLFSGNSCSSAIAARQSRSTKAGWSSRTESPWREFIASCARPARQGRSVGRVGPYPGAAARSFFRVTARRICTERGV